MAPSSIACAPHALFVGMPIRAGTPSGSLGSSNNAAMQQCSNAACTGHGVVDRHCAVERNSADRVRQGKGTALPVFGHHGRAAETVEEPAGFVRRARPGGGRSLSLAQKWAIWKHARVPMRRYGYTWQREDLL